MCCTLGFVHLYICPSHFNCCMGSVHFRGAVSHFTYATDAQIHSLPSSPTSTLIVSICKLLHYTNSPTPVNVPLRNRSPYIPLCLVSIPKGLTGRIQPKFTRPFSLREGGVWGRENLPEGITANNGEEIYYVDKSSRW